MGGFDVGGLFASLGLDDSQFKEALATSKVGTAVLTQEIAKLRAEVLALVPDLVRAGASLSTIASALGADADAVGEYSRALLALRVVQDEVTASMVKEGVVIQEKTAAEIKAANDKIRLANQVAEGEARAAEWKAAIIKRVNDNDVRMANQYAEGQARTNAIVMEGANQRIALNNKIAAGEARMVAEYKANFDMMVAAEVRRADEYAIAASIMQAREAEYTSMYLGLLKEREAAAAREAETRIALANQVAVGTARAESINTEAAKAAANARVALANQMAKGQEMADAINNAGGSMPKVGLRAGINGITPVSSLSTGPMMAGAAALFGGYEAIKEAAKFDDAMNKSLSIMGEVSDAMKGEMREAALSLSRQYGMSADEIAKSFYFMASAGLTAKEALESVTSVTKFAFVASADGVMKADKAAELLMTVKNALGGSAGDITRISDLLLKADQIAAGTGEQFAQALAGKGAGALRILGKSMEEGLAILAAFASVGIRGADAQTAMVQILRDFRVQAEKHKDVMISLNGETMTYSQLVYDAAGKMRPMADILQTLEKLFRGASTETITHDLALLGLQQRTTQTTQALLGMSDKVRGFQAQLHEAAGSTDKIADKRLESAVVQWDRLVEAVRTLAIDWGTLLLPGLNAIMRGMTDLATIAHSVYLELSSLGDSEMGKAIGTFLGWFATVLKVASGLETLSFIVGHVKSAVGTPENLKMPKPSSLMDKVIEEIDVKGLVSRQSDIDKDTDKAAKNRARLFSNLGLTDYKTTIDQLKQDLAEATKDGLLSPAQTLAAKEKIEELTVAWKGLNTEVKGFAQGPNKVFTMPSAIPVQMDPIRALKQSYKELLELTGNASIQRLLPGIPALISEEPAQNMEDLTKQTERWNASLAKTHDTLTKITAEMLKEGITTINGPTGQNTSPDRIASLLKDLGIHDSRADINSTRNEKTKELVEDTTAALIDKQKALILLFEDMAQASGKSAEQISQEQKLTINGVVQDYSVLKDKVKNSLSLVGKAWQDLTHDLEQIAMSGLGKLGGALFDTLFPDFTNPKNSDPLGPLVDNLRGAFEKLSAYSDPKGALNGLIASIKGAGTAAQANAIAVKYFGATAGPMLASELRNGTISATDLSEALKLATQSTLEFANKSSEQASALSQLWRQVVRDIVVAIMERLIMVGIVQLLIWLGVINKQTQSMASAMEQVFTKMAAMLVKLFTGVSAAIVSSVKATIKAVEAAINGMYAEATVVIRTITINEVQNVPSLGGGGGGDLFMGGGGGYGGGGGFGGYNWDWLYNLPVGRGNGGGEYEMNAANRRSGGRNVSPSTLRSNGGGNGINIGTMHVTTNDPKDFVRKLKQLRLVEGF